MAHDEAYHKAEKKIEVARRSRATYLGLSGQQLTELPETLGYLTELTSLDLSRNNLEQIPFSTNRQSS